MLPLEGIRVLDLSRLAPGPFCTMLLADLGADVLLIEAPGDAIRGGNVSTAQLGGDAERIAAYDALRRNKRSIVLNLRTDEACRIFRTLAADADVIVEGFRPGVVKRLGVDYQTLKAINPRLVYCSLSGYGQDGPYAGMAGHDINYISIGGALGAIGRPGQPPAIPLNVIADFAGGGLHAAYGILAALLAREKTGQGQLVDIGMSDGVMYLMAFFISHYLAAGSIPTPSGHLLNGGAPFYDVYEAKDGGWVSVGALEPQFFANLCRALNGDRFMSSQFDESTWPEMRAFFTEQFKSKKRDEWFEELKGSDCCVTPVYTLGEALTDPHNRHRRMEIETAHPTFGKVRQVGIGTKLSETPGAVRLPAPRPGEHTDDILKRLGYSPGDITSLRASQAIA